MTNSLTLAGYWWWIFHIWCLL